MIETLPSILIPVMIDAIAVLGLYVIAACGKLSAGHAAFFGIGGYAGGLASVHLSIPAPLAIGLGMIFAGLCGGLFALIADRLGHWFFAVTTLAFAMMMIGIVSGLDSLGGATGLYRIPLAVGFREVILCLGATIGFVAWLDSTRFGRAMRAVRDSDLAAQSLAIDPMRVRVISFAIGTGIAGLAGGLWSHYLGLIKPSDMSLDRSLLYLIYISIGGIDLWIGALFGTFVLGLLPEFIRFSRGYRFVLFGGLLAFVMVLRPAGLITKREIDMLRGAWRWLRGLIATKPSIASKGPNP